MLLACPGCRQQLNIPDGVAGQQVRCPLCQVVFGVPAAPGASAPLPPPPAHEPPARAPAPPPDPRGGGGPPRRERDFGDEDDRGRGEGGFLPHALTRGANHLLISAIVFTVAAVLLTLLDLIITGERGSFRSDAYMTGVCAGILMRLLLLGTTIVFQFIGASLLRRARGRGVVLTAAILGIVLSGLGALGVLLGLIVLVGPANRGLGETGMVMTALSLMLILGAVVYGFIAGITTLTVLGRPEVREAFERNAPRWGPPRRDWYDDRRGRDDDRRERYDDERW